MVDANMTLFILFLCSTFATPPASPSSAPAFLLSPRLLTRIRHISQLQACTQYVWGGIQSNFSLKNSNFLAGKIQTKIQTKIQKNHKSFMSDADMALLTLLLSSTFGTYLYIRHPSRTSQLCTRFPPLSPFVHEDWTHFLGNASGLVLVWHPVIAGFGPTQSFVGFCVSGTLSAMVSKRFRPEGLSLGASAAVLALGAVAAGEYDDVRPIGAVCGVIVASVVCLRLNWLRNVDHVAHLCGLGLGGGMALAKRRWREEVWR